MWSVVQSGGSVMSEVYDVGQFPNMRYLVVVVCSVVYVREVL